MAIQTALDSISNSSGSPFGFKNRIINGDMRIDQRNAGASVTLSGTTQYAVDRFGAFKDTAGATCTAQQSSTTPNGSYTKSLLWTTTTGSAPGVSEDSCIRQYIEGYNFSDFGFGSAAAQSITLSFWVRSSITGTYGVSFANSVANRCYMATYTVNATNTWEQKTITIVGDTSGTWVTDNGLGLRIFWDMGSGSSRSIAASSAWGSSYGTGLTGGVKISANTGATFYITGVQLEKGSTASAFDYRDYGSELALCQRYYEKIGGTTAADIYYIGGGTSGYNFSTTIGMVYKRVAPVVAVVGTWTVVTCNQPSVRSTTEQCITLGSSWTGTTGSGSFASTTSAYLTASAEL